MPRLKQMKLQRWLPIFGDQQKKRNGRFQINSYKFKKQIDKNVVVQLVDKIPHEQYWKILKNSSSK